MANKFNLTAEINLRGPSNIKNVVSGIRKQLGTVTADVKLKIDPSASKNIDSITKKLNAMNAVLVSAKTNTNDLNISLKNLSSAIQAVNSVNTKAISTTTQSAQATANVAKSAQLASSKMEEFGQQSALAIKRFAAFSLVTTGVFAFTNALTQGIKSFIEFDRQLVRLQQITGQTKTQIQSVEESITSLSVNLGVSSAALINIADTLAQAGLTANETRIALIALAKTELAPSFDNLAQTTEGAIAVLRQFNLEVTDLEAALGSINAVSARFAVESSDIIAAIQRTGGVFASTSRGVSEGKDALNEFIAVFTSVRATTRESAETIATGLRTIFTRIQRGGTIKQLREFGVELQDLEGKFVGPFEAVKRLSEALNQLDPRDIRFSTIVEELGGFRQIGKVLPLIQQFAVAQEALKVAQSGQSSLAGAQIKSQQALAIQFAKVREEFLALVRDIGKSSSFQALASIVLGLASTFIKLVSAFKPILPILAVIGAIKGASAVTKFAGGFFGALNKGGGAQAAGSSIGATVTGTTEKERAQAVSKASEATKNNTNALVSLTSAIQSLENKIISMGGPATISGGGRVLGFNKGGVVPGTGRGDKVPALLEPGEVVMNNNAVNKYGRGNLVRMNKYALGGQVELTGKKLSGTYSSLKNKVELNTKYLANIDPIPQSTKAIKPRMEKLKEQKPEYPNWKLFEYAVGERYKLSVAGGNKFLDFPGVLGEAKFMRPDGTYAQDKETGFVKGNNNETMLAKLIGSEKYNKNSTVRAYYPENINDFRNFVFGGKIQKLMAGSPGGIRVPSGKGRGVKGAKGARSKFKDLNETELAQLSTRDLIAYAKDQAEDVFTTGGAGLAVANEFISVPQERIIPELESELTTYLGQKGFWREKIAPFGSPERTQAVTERKMDARTLRNMVATAGGVDSSALEDVPMDALLKYAEQAPRAPKEVLEKTAAKYASISSIKPKFQEWGKNSSSGVFADIVSGLEDQIRDQLEEPNRGRFDSLIAAGSLDAYKAAGGKDGHIPPLKKAIYEAIGVTEKSAGGLIQKFMAGSTGGITEETIDSSDIIRSIERLGGPGSIRQLIGVDKIKSSLKEFKQPPTAKQLFSKTFLNSENSAPYLSTIGNLVKEAEGAVNKPRVFSQEEKNNATKLAVVGLTPFDLNEFKFEELAGRIVSINSATLKSDKAPAVEQMRSEIDKVLNNFATNLGGQNLSELDASTKEAIGLGNLEGYMIEAVLAKLGANPGKLDDRSVDYAGGLGRAANLFGVDPNIPTEVKRDVKGGLSKARVNFANYFDGQDIKEFAVGGLAEATGSMQSLMSGLYGDKQQQQEVKKQQKAFGQIALRTGNRIQATYVKDGEAGQARSGQVIADKVGSSIYAVQSSAATKGYGPKLYDVVMEAATAAGGMLTSDRKSVSADAKKVWDFYFNNRADVKKTPLDPENWVSNSRLLDKKLYGPPDTWPEATDPAWILQSGYSKAPSDINNPDLVVKKFAGGLIKRFASGGTVPAMVSNGEAFVPPNVAKKIGYSKLDKMNQADRNGMKGFASGGISTFKGAGNGTSDSIGPIGLPTGSYVIREKATKALGLNKGGGVGIRKFEEGGRLSKDERKRRKEEFLATQRGGITREEARAVGMPRPDFGAGASRKRDVMATPQGEINVKNIEAEVLNNYEKLYAEEKKRIDELYTTLQSEAADRYFKGEINFDEFNTTIDDLVSFADLSKKQAKDKLTAQAQTAQVKAVEEYKTGKQAPAIEQRKSADAGTFSTEVQSSMDQVVKEAKAKYEALYSEEKQSLKDYYQAKAKNVADEGGDVAAVIDEYKAAIGELKQSIESGFGTEVKEKQAQVPEQIAEQKRVQVEEKRETEARAADPFYDAKKAADEYALSVGNAAETSKQMAEEQKSYIEYLAREKGLSSKGLKRELTKNVAKESYQVKARSRFGQEELKAVAAGSSQSLRGKDVAALVQPGSDDQESRKVQDIVSAFEAKIKEINPTIDGGQARAAAIKLADGLSKGDKSVQQLIASDEELNKLLGTQISDADAYNEAIRRTAAAAGISEEALRSLASSTEVERREFAETPEGKRYGVLAEMMPDQVKQFSQGGLGKGLGKVDDFFTGKGGILSKGAAKLGGFSGIAAGATAAIPFAAESLLTKEQMKDPNVAGGLSAATGALSMGAAAYQMTGGGVTGLIAAAGAALLGGIKGWFEGKNQAIFTNAMDNLAKTTSGLEHAFKELEKEASPKNIKEFNKAAGDAFIAQQDISNIAFSEERSVLGSATSGEALAGAASGAAIGAAIGSIVPVVGTAVGAAVGAGLGYLAGAFTDYYSKFDPQQIAEAGAAYVNSAVSQYEMQTRGAEIKTDKKSIDEVDAMMKAIKDGSTAAGPIVQSYAEALRATGKFGKEQIDVMADEESAIAAFLQVKKAQLGSEELAIVELKKNKDAAIEAGRGFRTAAEERMLKENQLKNAIKEVAVATESLLDIYRRLGANIQRFSDEMGDVVGNVNSYTNDLTGSSTVKDVDRGGSERILGNISAYSAEEVKSAAGNVSATLGNTPEAKTLADTATASKIISDQLPALLKSNQGNRGDAIDQLEQLLSSQGLDSAAITTVLEDMRKTVGDSEGKDTGTLIGEIESGILNEFSKAADEGAKKLQELSKTYNDTIQNFINLQNQQNAAILKANEYYRQSAQIRLNAELDLAKALGKNLSLDELNKPFETEMGSLTQGLKDIGVLGEGASMDPAAIAQGIQTATERNAAIEQSQTEIGGQLKGTTDDGQRRALNDAQLNNTQALGENARALEEGKAALQKLATDGSKAANALAKIQEEQKKLEAFGSALDTALTASPEELAKMNTNTDAMNRVLAGDTRKLKTSEGRQQAFAGLQQDKDLIGQEEYNKRLAVFRRSALIETQGEVTPEQEKMLSRLETGLPDEEDPNVKAYREAVAVQVDATNKLGDLQMQSADKIGIAMDDLRMFLQDKFPDLLAKAVTDAKTASATATEVGKPKETSPEVKAEKQRREEADKSAAERQKEIEKAEKQAKMESDRAVRLDKKATSSESWGADPVGRGLATNAAEQARESEAKLERLKAEDKVAKDKEEKERGTFDSSRKQQEEEAKQAKSADEAKKASDDRAKTEDVIDRARGTRQGTTAPPIEAPPPPGPRTRAAVEYQAQTAVQATRVDPIEQTMRQSQTRQSTANLEQLELAKTNRKEEIQKRANKLKVSRVAAIGADTLKDESGQVVNPNVLAAQSSLQASEDALVTIEKQIAEEKAKLAALKELEQTQAQTVQTQQVSGGLVGPSGNVYSRSRPTEQQSVTAYDTLYRAARGEEIRPPRLSQTSPIPTPPVSTTSQPETERPPRGGPAEGMGYSLTVDDKSVQFLTDLTNTFNTFGTYVDKLANLDLKLELTGNYTIDVNITGSAGLAALDKNMRELATDLIEVKISELRNEISSVTRGAVKPSGSKPKGGKK